MCLESKVLCCCVQVAALTRNALEALPSLIDLVYPFLRTLPTKVNFCNARKLAFLIAPEDRNSPLTFQSVV